MANNLKEKIGNKSKHWDELKFEINNVDNFESQNPYFNQLHKITDKYKGVRLSNFITCFGIFFQNKNTMEQYFSEELINYIEEDIHKKIINALSRYPNYIMKVKGDDNSLGFLFKENHNSDYLFEMAHTVYKIAKTKGMWIKEKHNVNFYPTIAISMSIMQSAPVVNKGLQKMSNQKDEIYQRLGNSIAHSAYFVDEEPGIPMVLDVWVYNKLTEDFKWLIKDFSDTNCIVAGPEQKIKVNFLSLASFFESINR